MGQRLSKVHTRYALAFVDDRDGTPERTTRSRSGTTSTTMSGTSVHPSTPRSRPGTPCLHPNHYGLNYQPSSPDALPHIFYTHKGKEPMGQQALHTGVNSRLSGVFAKQQERQDSGFGGDVWSYGRARASSSTSDQESLRTKANMSYAPTPIAETPLSMPDNSHDAHLRFLSDLHYINQTYYADLLPQSTAPNSPMARTNTADAVSDYTSLQAQQDYFSLPYSHHTSPSVPTAASALIPTLLRTTGTELTPLDSTMEMLAAETEPDFEEVDENASVPFARRVTCSEVLAGLPRLATPPSRAHNPEDPPPPHLARAHPAVRRAFQYAQGSPHSPGQTKVNDQVIDLEGRKVVKLSRNIGLLSGLRVLNLANNDLMSIPRTVGYLKNLTTLNLSHNNLTVLPDTISYLKNLVELDCSHNRLVTIPAGIGHLTKLTTLLLNDNADLQQLPQEMGNVASLVTLDLSNTALSTIPAEVSRLQYLRRLRLDDCPLVESFSHEIAHNPPSLKEVCARTIVRNSLPILAATADDIKDYLVSHRTCSFCGGPFYDSFVVRGRIVEKGDGVFVPYEYKLCAAHWNDESERVHCLFAGRPDTAPKVSTTLPISSRRKGRAGKKAPLAKSVELNTRSGYHLPTGAAALTASKSKRTSVCDTPAGLSTLPSAPTVTGNRTSLFVPVTTVPIKSLKKQPSLPALRLDLTDLDEHDLRYATDDEGDLSSHVSASAGSGWRRVLISSTRSPSMRGWSTGAASGAGTPSGLVA
ncbi:hypothetical protein BZG36_03429 [Bifiguratus adelaidae]|uniref:Disease resistance R13L4/SHOC-2-like LRR domain-containing protein n=1 Tax=Bifiguratus adelaidae TaxID=1938954 RepID=A0A261XYU4_9FUNG|nr:hypothetical protein BZG36_03429 [Bifiguratus adelaidae]